MSQYSRSRVVIKHTASSLRAYGNALINYEGKMMVVTKVTVGTKRVKSLGFTQSTCDSCIYVKIINDSPCLISVYVDDILIACKDHDDLTKIKHDLSSKFEMKDERFRKVVLFPRHKSHSKGQYNSLKSSIICQIIIR